VLEPAVLSDLRGRYAEPHRLCHDWDRVAEMLAMAEDLAHAIAERGAFILAVLFHKAVFDRRIPDWAERSAALMRQSLGAKWQAATLARAEALIRALAMQDLPPTRDPSLRGDAALLLDIDNAVLGAAPSRFEAHETAFRREYAHLSEDAYAAGRAASFEMLLWRERVYLTDRFYLEREKPARRNISAAVAKLRGA
jgi:predicted metal-dependent HD superfamily phosphohydrolase